MKSWVRGAAAAVAAMSAVMAMGSAMAQQPAADKAALTTDKDKVSYAIGLDIAHSFQPVAKYIDLNSLQSAVQNAFNGGQPLQGEDAAHATDNALRQNLAAAQGQLQGLPPGTTVPAVDPKQVGLMIGDRAVGPSLAPLKDAIELPVLMQAIRTSFAGGKSLLSDDEVKSVLTAFMTQRKADLANKYRTEGAAFLAKNKTEKGVITTTSGLQYQVLRAGSGPHPNAASTVRVNYEGKLLNGNVFDSSYKRGQPAEFPLSGVIAGWTEGIPLMGVGAKYRFWIPAELAYGENGQPQGGIPPNATLTFDVELLGVQP